MQCGSFSHGSVTDSDDEWGSTGVCGTHWPWALTPSVSAGALEGHSLFPSLSIPPSLSLTLPPFLPVTHCVYRVRRCSSCSPSCSHCSGVLRSGAEGPDTPCSSNGYIPFRTLTTWPTLSSLRPLQWSEVRGERLGGQDLLTSIRYKSDLNLELKPKI